MWQPATTTIKATIINKRFILPGTLIQPFNKYGMNFNCLN
jgi:hypothetical protein